MTHATGNSYDALNRLTQVLDPGNGTTQYVYDNANNLTQVTDPRGLATGYTYDGLNNLTKLVSPDTGTTTSTFDAAGNLATRVDARGATASYSVDALNRVTTLVYSKSGMPNETHTFSYDSGANAKGRLTQLTDPAATTTWTYTAHGRVASKTQTTATITRTLTYGYNAAGQLATLTTPSGQQIGYSYLNNRVLAVTVNGAALAGGIVITPFGPVGAWQWGNGIYTFRYYDTDGRLNAWEFRNGATVLRNDLTFDAASRITALADPITPTASGRLPIRRAGSAHRRATGQPAGSHRSNSATTRWATARPSTLDGGAANLYYGSNNNQLQSMVGVVNGNYLAGATALAHTYNNANRLTQVQSSGTPLASYAVNGLGQRVRKDVGATTTLFVYDEQGRLVGRVRRQWPSSSRRRCGSMICRLPRYGPPASVCRPRSRSTTCMPTTWVHRGRSPGPATIS